MTTGTPVVAPDRRGGCCCMRCGCLALCRLPHASAVHRERSGQDGHRDLAGRGIVQLAIGFETQRRAVIATENECAALTACNRWMLQVPPKYGESEHRRPLPARDLANRHSVQLPVVESRARRNAEGPTKHVAVGEHHHQVTLPGGVVELEIEAAKAPQRRQGGDYVRGCPPPDGRPLHAGEYVHVEPEPGRVAERDVAHHPQIDATRLAPMNQCREGRYIM